MNSESVISIWRASLHMISLVSSGIFVCFGTVLFPIGQDSPLLEKAMGFGMSVISFRPPWRICAAMYEVLR
jgi:hypothetical protein